MTEASHPTVAIGVRQLIAFSIFAEDICPGSPVQRMLEGGRAHRARQGSATESAYRAEVPLSLTVEGPALSLTISGRADALFLRDGLQVIEEIKLVPLLESPLTEALPEHRAQALCYGHMLSVQEGFSEVCLRVLYVRGDGSQIAAFEETLAAGALAAGFDALVAPMMAWQEKRHRHRLHRDESLVSLAFPYDTYRAGQRDFSAQVYYAIHLQKRLLAEAPTGIGKTLATLYPALKAQAEGKAGQIFYLTARTTGRALALDALALLSGRGAYCYALELTAKEKICPEKGLRCDPEECPRAKGFYLRLPEAVAEIEKQQLWSRGEVERVADQFGICPFEFSLSLAEIADVVICDYNYAFDPVARLKRVFLFRRDLTLLVDEAHQLVDRARSMFSAAVDTAVLRELRRDWGKQRGRATPPYRALTRLLRYFEAVRSTLSTPEATQDQPPEGLAEILAGALEVLFQADPLPGGAWMEGVFTLQRLWAIAQEYDDTYATLLRQHGKELLLSLYCLDPASRLAELTRKLQGVIFFSATLSPLAGYARMLGLEEEDGRLSLPSPFLPEHFFVLKKRVNTRYQYRAGSLPQVVEALLALVNAHPGNYLVMFPSYAYLRSVQEAIQEAAPGLRLLVQESGMDEAARDAFLAAFVPGGETLLGLTVMGGVFAEGIDLPGSRLSGCVIVGIGLPQICQEREALRAYFERTMGDGFAFAYRIPGLTKVVQAAGRVIRTSEDLGTLLLLDDRFFSPEVARLLPVHWRWQEASNIHRQAMEFWEAFNPFPAPGRDRGSHGGD